MSAATTIPHGRLAGRGAVVVLLGVAAAAHIPVIPDHLREATYMGLLFVAFTLACLAAAAALVLVLVDDPRLLTLAAASCGAAVVAYAATRLVAGQQPLAAAMEADLLRSTHPGSTTGGVAALRSSYSEVDEGRSGHG